MLRERFTEIVERTLKASIDHYGDRLLSFVIFGSVARGTMRPDSDIDLLLVVNDLPRGRLARMDDFRLLERTLETQIQDAARDGIHTDLSPLLKTPEEVEQGSPLFLDMTDQAKILLDRNGFFADHLDNLRKRLREQGAKRVRLGGGYYWILKPDLAPGEKIPL